MNINSYDLYCLMTLLLGGCNFLAIIYDFICLKSGQLDENSEEDPLICKFFALVAGILFGISGIMAYRMAVTVSNILFVTACIFEFAMNYTSGHARLERDGIFKTQKQDCYLLMNIYSLCTTIMPASFIVLSTSYYFPKLNETFLLGITCGIFMLSLIIFMYCGYKINERYEK